MSNSYGATYQNMMVVVQQMIDEAIKSRELKNIVEQKSSESDSPDSFSSSYLPTLVSIKDKLEGTPNVVLLREDLLDKDLLTKVVLSYSSGYYTTYSMVYNTVRDGGVRALKQLDAVVFSVYNNLNESVLTISIGLNYNSRGQVESIDVNDGSWE